MRTLWFENRTFQCATNPCWLGVQPVQSCEGTAGNILETVDTEQELLPCGVVHRAFRTPRLLHLLVAT